MILHKLRSGSLSREIGLIGDARIIEIRDIKSHRINGFQSAAAAGWALGVLHQTERDVA